VRSSWLPVLLLLAACDSGASGKTDEKKTQEPERKLAGVYAEHFDCKTVTTSEQIAQLLGAVKANLMVSAISPPRGVPQPCAYEVVMQSEIQAWTYDIDCRDGMKERADALFAQYKKTSAELVEAFNAQADAGIKQSDAGVAIRPPEDAVEVEVGAKALDHHGRGLLFIDDDAPCYVRVIGPDAPRRLELAKLVAKNLTFQNAPMTPRPAPQ
jgi:hypothetical protein